MKYALPFIALSLSGCAISITSTSNIAPIAPQSAQEALRPYYATLGTQLPKASPNPVLADDTVITRFAFGA